MPPFNIYRTSVSQTSWNMSRLFLLLLLFTTFTDSRNISCSKEDCQIQCAYKNDCIDSIINATNSDRINISCTDSTYIDVCTNLTIYCQYCTDFILKALYENANNVTIYANYATNIDIFCGSGSCSSLTVHGEYSANFVFTALGNNALNKVNIFAQNNSNLLNINCSNYGSSSSSTCTDLNIYATNANYVNITCDASASTDHGNYEYPGCDVINLFAENVNTFNIGPSVHHSILYLNHTSNVNIFSDLFIGITELDIYASNLRNEMNISCFGGFGESICYNIDIYMPSTHSTTNILCEGDVCTHIHFHYNQNEIIYSSTFVTINGCNICNNIDECMNIRNLQDDIDFDVEYKKNALQCKPYVSDSILVTTNDTVLQIGICLFYVSVAVLLCVTLMIIKCIYRKYTSIYPSNRPHLFILWYSFITDYIVYPSIFWWGFKLSMLNTSFRPFCIAKYSNEYSQMGVKYCIDSLVCDPWYSGSYNIRYCKSTMSGACECRSAKGFYGIMVTFWVQYAVVNWFQFFFWYIGCGGCDAKPIFTNKKAKARTYCGDGIVSHFLCCSMCRYLPSSFKQIVIKSFHQRLLFIGNQRYRRNRPDVQNYAMDHLLRFGPSILLVSIHIGLYGGVDTVYTIKWYEFLPVLLVLFVRIALQMSYCYGPKYDVNLEFATFVMRGLKSKFPDDIVDIILSYSPFFYDGNRCPQKMLYSKTHLEKAENVVSTIKYDI